MTSRTAPASYGGEFRPDIEGLRALAVISVLLYHARLAHVGGGYVGVDVFFVLSGFLITRLLVTEVDRTGGIALGAFWARRARRLLPASTLVIVATLVASVVLLDPLTRGFTGRSAVAASVFGANLLFWTRGGYSQLTLPEPLLHFWSLAVEEQFYLVWPLALVGLARLRGNFRRLVVLLAVPMAAASLIACIALTPSRQPFAFYWLPTRAWELLAGALLAVAAPSIVRGAPFLRGVLAWIGLMVIVLCAVGFRDPQDGFPGSLALLPVLATVAVILGGAHTDDGPRRLLQLAPLQWIGKRSYAIYLWHFPLLVLAEAKWGPLHWAIRVALLAASVGIAAVSFSLLEDPVRRSPWLAVRARRSLLVGVGLVATGLVGSAVLLAAGTGIATGGESAPPTLAVETVDPAPVSSTATTTPATGAPGGSTTSPVSSSTAAPTATGRNPGALERLAAANAQQLVDAVRTRVVPSNLEPSLSKVYGDTSIVYSDGCLLDNGKTEAKECAYGDTSSSTVVVLFGDSHAAQWFPAFESLAKEQGWRLVLMAKKHCPAGDVPQPETGYTGQCSRWRTKVYERLAVLKPTVVVMSSLWYRGVPFGKYREGWERTFAAVKPHAKHVVYLADTPIRKSDVPSCVASHPRSVNQCTVTRRSAINPTRRRADRAATRNQGVDHIIPDDWLCDPTRCAVIIGNVLLYRDQTHLTLAAARFLTPYVAVMLKPYLGA